MIHDRGGSSKATRRYTRPPGLHALTLPLLATLDMGYGHLRAALPLAEALGVPVVEVDRPPCATPEEQKTWLTARRLYEGASRGVQTPLIGGLVRSALEAFTAIAPLHPYRDQSAPTREVRVLDRLIRGGLGRGLARRLDEEGRLCSRRTSRRHSAPIATRACPSIASSPTRT